MRTPLALFGLLLAMLAGSFALAAVHAVSKPPAATDGDRHVIYAPLVAHESSGLPPTVVVNQATVTATATTTATATATATVTVSATSTATPNNCNPEPEADLSGELIADNQGRIINHSANCSYDVGLASYQAFDRHIRNQQLFDSSTATLLPGQTLDLTVNVPDCTAQIDLFYGPLLLSLDGQRYGERLLASHFVGEDFCTPGSTPRPTATPGPTATPTATVRATASPTETPGGGG
jgi:hypothetical protein